MSEKVLLVGDAPLTLAALLAAGTVSPPESDQFVAEGALLGEIVDRAAQTQKEGSFSARNPALGKMVKCKVCGIRERAGEHQCTATVKNPVTMNRKQARQIREVQAKTK